MYLYTSPGLFTVCPRARTFQLEQDSLEGVLGHLPLTFRLRIRPWLAGYLCTGDVIVSATFAAVIPSFHTLYCLHINQSSRVVKIARAQSYGTLYGMDGTYRYHLYISYKIYLDLLLLTFSMYGCFCVLYVSVSKYPHPISKAPRGSFKRDHGEGI